MKNYQIRYRFVLGAGWHEPIGTRTTKKGRGGDAEQAEERLPTGQGRACDSELGEAGGASYRFALLWRSCLCCGPCGLFGICEGMRTGRFARDVRDHAIGVRLCKGIRGCGSCLAGIRPTPWIAFRRIAPRCAFAPLSLSRLLMASLLSAADPSSCPPLVAGRHADRPAVAFLRAALPARAQ